MKSQKLGHAEGPTKLKPQEKTFIMVGKAVIVGAPTTFEYGPKTAGEFIQGVTYKLGRLLGRSGD